MTPDQVKLVVAAHAHQLGVRALKNVDNPNPGHLVWMCEEVPKFLDEGRIEKAMRWLGFIQGVIVAKKLITIEEAKRLNDPGPAKAPPQCLECEDNGQIHVEEDSWDFCSCPAGVKLAADIDT
jgi:hypothetical protein